MTGLLIPGMQMWPIVLLERLCLEKEEEHMDGQEPQKIINLDLKLLSIMLVRLVSNFLCLDCNWTRVNVQILFPSASI